MLKGMWVRFVLELVTSVRADYDWSNTLLLFMNVVNGALLLHGEDQTILYYSLVTMLTTVTKFNPIFVKDGYQMIIPTLVQVRRIYYMTRGQSDWSVGRCGILLAILSSLGRLQGKVVRWVRSSPTGHWFEPPFFSLPIFPCIALPVMFIGCNKTSIYATNPKTAENHVKNDTLWLP